MRAARRVTPAFSIQNLESRIALYKQLINVRPERIRFNFYTAGGVAAMLCDGFQRLHILGDLFSSFWAFVYPVCLYRRICICTWQISGEPPCWLEYPVVLTINIHLPNISGDT